MNMKMLLLVLIYALPAAASAATVAVLPVTPYRSLDDSPWKEAVQAGDALKFRFGDCNEHADTLPSGFGVHDDFEDRDCLSPWMRIVHGEIDRGASVLGSNGPNGFSEEYYLSPTYVNGTLEQKIQMEFIPTVDNMLPSWLGFTVIGAQNFPEAITLNLLGTSGNIFASINLTNLLFTESNVFTLYGYAFIGIETEQPVSAVQFSNPNLTLDHFQYGYGTPVPEPAAPALAATACLLFLRRKRTK